MKRLACVALLLLPACGPATGKGADGGMLDPTKDNDGDGVTISQGDCDDRDPTSYPGAPELCDARDNDCDKNVDGACDNDKDGYSRDSGDCDDNDALINPGALEVADNMLDDNCNRATDEMVA